MTEKSLEYVSVNQDTFPASNGVNKEVIAVKKLRN